MSHIINILATWRLMELLRDEDAPYDVLKRSRLYVQLNRKPDAKMGTYGRFLSEVHNALMCNWCLSIWCGLFVALANRQNPVTGLAYSAGALFISQFREGQKYDHSNIFKQLSGK